MITEDYVSFETAKLMHDKGFNLAEFHGRWAIDYDNVPNTDEEDLDGKIIVAEWQYPLITIQMAMKWLREKHNLGVFPSWSQVFGLYGCRMYYLKKGSQEFYSVGVRYNTYEEACEAAIKYCLENLI